MGYPPDPSERKLLEATVGPGQYRVLTRWPLTIAFGPRAYGPALMGALIALGVGARHSVGTGAVAAAIAGAGTAVAVAAHEAGHLLSSRHVRGLIPRILLLRGSGAAAIVEGRFQDPRGAALFAAGGPLASLLFTVVYITAAVVVPWQPAAIGFYVTGLLTALVLALNLLPVAPTDGYALFRSLLWAETGSRDEAERRALAWSRVVLAAGIVIALELAARHDDTSALAVLLVLVALTVQHHAVARRFAREHAKQS